MPNQSEIGDAGKLQLCLNYTLNFKAEKQVAMETIDECY
jgi:hypothetical protein